MKRPAIAALVVLMLGSVVRAEEKPKEAWERIVADISSCPEDHGRHFRRHGADGNDRPILVPKSFHAQETDRETCYGCST